MKMNQKEKDGALVGGAIGLVVGGVPGAIVGGFGGALLNNNMKKPKPKKKSKRKTIKSRADGVVRDIMK